MKRLLLSCSLVLVACGGSVASEPSSEPPRATQPDASPPEPPVEWSETASCEAVTASCGGDPSVVVRGHASGLAGLDGARVEFAVRYLLTAGEGLDVPHGVALGRTHVKGGEFATCVCVPHGAGSYPEVAAVVYAPGTTGLTGRDAERATFSRRFATLGDEDVSYALNAAPSEVQKEAAVAAMIARTAKTTLEIATAEKGFVYAGLVADERPITAHIATVTEAAPGIGLTWHMPGRAWSSERVAFFVDRNANGKCDTDGSDVGAVVPFASAIRFADEWLAGVELGSVCEALRPEASRE